MTGAETDVAGPRASADPGANGGEPHGAALVAAGVVKRWRTRDAPVVLDGVDLAVDHGKTVSITGANGAGKTTLLRVVAGLIRPDRGTISLNGIASERDARRYRSRIGLLSAGNTGLFARLSVYTHLEYVARLALMPTAEVESEAERMLDAFALREIMYRRVDRLSMGQRQRVRSALTFVHGPDVVLLDEPQTSLDEEGTALLRDMVGAHLARGGAAVWCSPAGMQDEGNFDEELLLREGKLGPA